MPVHSPTSPPKTATRQGAAPAAAEPLWDVAEAAAFLKVPEKTLYQWRYKGYGPRAHRIGRHVRYFPDDVRAWVKEQD